MKLIMLIPLLLAQTEDIPVTTSITDDVSVLDLHNMEPKAAIIHRHELAGFDSPEIEVHTVGSQRNLSVSIPECIFFNAEIGI